MTTYKKRYTRIISLVFTLFIIVSCSTSSGPEGQSSLDSLKQIQTDSVQNQITYNKIYKKYNLPIPIELFSEIKYKSPDFINESLNSPANLPRYQTTVSKAFNLGIYAADLAYCSVFNRSQEAKNFMIH